MPATGPRGPKPAQGGRIYASGVRPSTLFGRRRRAARVRRRYPQNRSRRRPAPHGSALGWPRPASAGADALRPQPDPELTLRILHAADLHLGSPLRGLAARDPALADLFDRATWRAFETMVALAVDEGVDLVVIAGDVFDRDWKDWSTGQAFVREMARLARAGIRVVMIRGNHDAESVISRDLPLPDGVRWLGADRPETVDFEDLGVAVHGMSFKGRAVTESMVGGYPAALPGRYNIGLLHTSLDGREGVERYAPCSAADLSLKSYDYWALGHIHAREVVATDAHTVVFPGNIQGRSVRECGAKGVTLVTVDAGRTTLEHRPVDAARWAVVEVDAGGLETRDRLVGAAGRAFAAALDAADGRPLAARVRILGETALDDRLRADRDTLAAELQAAAAAVSDRILLEKTRVETRPPPAAAPSLGIADLEEALDRVVADPAFAAQLAADEAALFDRMPPGARDLLDGDAAAVLAAARALVRAGLAGED